MKWHIVYKITQGSLLAKFLSHENFASTPWKNLKSCIYAFVYLRLSSLWNILTNCWCMQKDPAWLCSRIPRLELSPHRTTLELSAHLSVQIYMFVKVFLHIFVFIPSHICIYYFTYLYLEKQNICANLYICKCVPSHICI